MGGSRSERGGWGRLERPRRAWAAGLLLAALALVAPQGAQATGIGHSGHHDDDDGGDHRSLRWGRDAGRDFHAHLVETLQGKLEKFHRGDHFDPWVSLDELKRRWLADHREKRERFDWPDVEWKPDGGGDEGEGERGAITPEPSTLLLLAGGLGALSLGRRRRG